jgi:hypothetical protein
MDQLSADRMLHLSFTGERLLTLDLGSLAEQRDLAAQSQ